MALGAQKLVDEIAKGVIDALKTNELFLGIEQFEFENADIHPEYVTTVKVAENLTGTDRIVSLETLMKALRRDAAGLARLKFLSQTEKWKEIDETVNRFKFGKVDSRRIDIVVRISDSNKPPILLAEVKLGIKNLAGVLADIDRVIKLISMYYELGLLDKSDVYGAVIFHLMKQGKDTAKVPQLNQNFLNGIHAHLASQKINHRWLNARAEMLSSSQIAGKVSGYQEFHDDGSVENIFGKEEFTFMPGLILLGNATDINSANF